MGGTSPFAVGRKHRVKGAGTVMRWVRKYGSERYGKVIRVEKADEVDEGKKLRAELRRVKEALADAHKAIKRNPKMKVVCVCQKAGMTPQNYYARREVRKRQDVDVELMLELVTAERRDQPRLGVRNRSTTRIEGASMRRMRTWDERREQG